VVTLSAEIDITNAEDVRDQLTAAITPGTTTIIADLTPTTFCDTAGLQAMILAHRHATAAGAALRLAIPGPHLARLFTITGLDRYLAIYPTLTAAHAAPPHPGAHR
jgi:anti-sigma B factor antagonist